MAKRTLRSGATITEQWEKTETVPADEQLGLSPYVRTTAYAFRSDGKVLSGLRTKAVGGGRSQNLGWTKSRYQPNDELRAKLRAAGYHQVPVAGRRPG